MQLIPGRTYAAIPLTRMRVFLVLVAAATAACTDEPTGVEHISVGGHADTMIAFVEQLLALDDTAYAVWPGFRFSEQAIVLSHPSGPTLVLGMSHPLPEFVPVKSRPEIYIREGIPPDSLSFERIAEVWEGGPASVFVFSDSEGFLRHVVHEIFHSYQSSTWGAATANTSFPDTSFSALTWLNLEGRYLAKALKATSQTQARHAARTTLAIRHRRCQVVGERECQAERRLEQMEGSARYVEVRLTNDKAPLSMDAVGSAVSAVSHIERLERFHFYDTGAALMFLLDRLGDESWKNNLPQTPPDILLANLVSFSSSQVDSLVQEALRSPDASRALSDARDAISSEAALVDSVTHLLSDRPGTEVKIHVDPEKLVGLGVMIDYDPSATRQRVRLSGDHRNRSTYFMGARSVQFNFANGESHLIFGLPPLWTCCTSVMLQAKTSLKNGTATVDGVKVFLDRPNPKVRGRLRLRTPELDFHIQDADLQVFSDSVAIWVH